jgi:hypothetical protein
MTTNRGARIDPAAKIEKPRVVSRAFGERWTRTQRIRTTGAIPVEVVIVDHAEAPVHMRIAGKAKHLRELGMSDRAIARALGVSDKTVAKAVTPPTTSA